MQIIPMMANQMGKKLEHERGTQGIRGIHIYIYTHICTYRGSSKQILSTFGLKACKDCMVFFRFRRVEFRVQRSGYMVEIVITNGGLLSGEEIVKQPSSPY